MSEHTSTTNSNVLTEAPASWNTRYLSPEGFVCQITLRANSGKELLEKAATAITFLLEHGCQPVETGFPKRSSEGKATASNGNGSGNGNTTCPIHGAEMRRWEKNGKVWFSHKTEDGEWCTGKGK